MVTGATERRSEIPTSRIEVRVDEGKANNTQFSFSNEFCIGRDSGCDVQIMDDPSVSRTHAEVSFYEGSWWLRDVGSTNGTYVDGQKIDIVPLRTSLKLRVGTGKTVLSLIPQRA